MRNMASAEATTTILFHVQLPRELHTRMWEVAKAEDRSLSAEMRRALAEHVERYAGTAEPGEDQERTSS